MLLERPVADAGLEGLAVDGRIVWYRRPEMFNRLTTPAGCRCRRCGMGRVRICAACGRASAKGFPTDGGGMVCYPCSR